MMTITNLLWRHHNRPVWWYKNCGKWSALWQCYW